MEKAIIITLIISAVAILLIPFLRYQNNAIVKTYSTLGMGSKRALRIVHLSDLHEKDFKGKLTEKIKEASPDIIVITGDTLNCNKKTDIEFVKSQLREFSDIAPVYFVSGNHEADGMTCRELYKLGCECKAVYLDSKAVVIEHNGYKFNICGLKEPLLYTEIKATDRKYDKKKAGELLIKDANKLLRNDMMNIMLAHHPEFFEYYNKTRAELVLCGHAHGGQFILFGMPIYAPGQGIFPQYAQGLHKKNNKIMIVSRGLGKSSRFPQRLFNRPELGIIDIMADGSFVKE